MNRLFNNKRKKNPEASQLDTFTVIPTSILTGPVSYQEEWNLGPEGNQSRSYQDPAVD